MIHNHEVGSSSLPRATSSLGKPLTTRGFFVALSGTRPVAGMERAFGAAERRVETRFVSMTAPGPAKADPEHIVWTTGYRDPELLGYVAGSMAHFGWVEVRRATIFKRLAEVEEVYRLHDPSYMGDEKRKLLVEVMLDHLVDDFRIVVFYENWMKARLLMEGVCIHKFKGARSKELNKFLEQPWSGTNIMVAGITDDEIARTTVNMTRLLSKAYQVVIRMPADVHAIVSKINKRRNRLHFYTHNELGMGPGVVQEYRMLFDHIQHCRTQALGELSILS